MTYKEAVAFIQNLENKMYPPSHENSVELMKQLGNPQDTMKVIHVAGTNGKGSTIAFTKQILIEAGLKVGTFTSPHIFNYNELVTINMSPWHEAAFAEDMTLVSQACQALLEKGMPHPTAFECLTAAGLLTLSKSEIDLAIIEVGMGGLKDATNVFTKPNLLVITSISYDHEEFLGNSLEAIASHKAGIIKKDVPLILGPNPFEVIEVVTRKMEGSSAKMYVLDEGLIHVKEVLTTNTHQFFNMNTTFFNHTGLSTRLRGTHQYKNLATALLIVNRLQKEYDIPEDAIRRGVRNTSWPCRGELIQTTPPIMIDGAHNEDGMRALLTMVKKYYKDYRLVVVTGILRDKQCKKIADLIESYADEIILTSPISSRRLEPSIYKEHFANALVYDDYIKAIEKALSSLDNRTLLLIAGSLYLAFPARKYLLERLNLPL